MKRAWSRGTLTLLLAAGLLASCQTGRPAGTPVTPLSASTADEALAQLRERREAFREMRSLMRVRATTNGETRSFRAQLIVRDAQRMELVAYTPVGTTALTMKATGHRITSVPEVPPASFDFLRAAGLTPAETAMLLLGFPPEAAIRLEAVPDGLASASAGEIVVTFDPPSFPARHVVVTRGADRIELEHLEIVQ